MPPPVFSTFVLRLGCAASLVTIATIVEVHILQPLGVHHPFVIFYAPVAVAAIFLGLAGGLAATLFSALSAVYFSIEPESRFVIAEVVDQVYVGVFILQGCLVSYAAHWMRRAKVAETERDLARERVRSAEQVRENEERLRLALESARTELWNRNLASDLSESNDQEYDLPKGEADDPVQRFFESPPDYSGDMKIFLDQVLAQGQEFYHEFQIVRPDQEIVRDELEQRVQERTAELREALETLKKESGERIESVNMLIHQSGLAAMGEMIGNIAHQWRQPLNTMGLIVEEVPIMYRKGELSEEYLKAQMAKAKDLMLHMSQTIEDFRTFFRPTEEKSLFKAAEMIRKTLNLVEDTLKNQQITVEVKSDDDPDIYGYMGECCQVLLNLLVNSRDALLARNSEAGRFIMVRAFSEGGRSVLTVSDNAGGIPDEIIHRIFEPYFTTKGPETGTVFGLYMARNVIERRMNGKFTARNTNGSAEFRIEVPSREH